MREARLDLMLAQRGHDDDVAAFYLELWLQQLRRTFGPADDDEPYEEYGGEA